MALLFLFPFARSFPSQYLSPPFFSPHRTSPVTEVTSIATFRSVAHFLPARCPTPCVYLTWPVRLHLVCKVHLFFTHSPDVMPFSSPSSDLTWSSSQLFGFGEARALAYALMRLRGSSPVGLIRFLTQRRFCRVFAPPCLPRPLEAIGAAPPLSLLLFSGISWSGLPFLPPTTCSLFTVIMSFPASHAAPFPLGVGVLIFPSSDFSYVSLFIPSGWLWSGRAL